MVIGFDNLRPNEHGKIVKSDTLHHNIDWIVEVRGGDRRDGLGLVTRRPDATALVFSSCNQPNPTQLESNPTQPNPT